MKADWLDAHYARRWVQPVWEDAGGAGEVPFAILDKVEGIRELERREAAYRTVREVRRLCQEKVTA